MRKIILTNGLIAGFLIPLVMGLVVLVAGKESGFTEIAGFASMIIALSTIYLGIRQYRDREKAGQITFWQGVKVGLLITLIATVIYVISWTIYYYMGPGQVMMEQYFQNQIDQLQAAGDSSKIQSMEQMQANYSKPIVLIGYTFMEIFPIGLLITLISALIIKR